MAHGHGPPVRQQAIGHLPQKVMRMRHGIRIPEQREQLAPAEGIGSARQETVAKGFIIRGQNGV